MVLTASSIFLKQRPSFMGGVSKFPPNFCQKYFKVLDLLKAITQSISAQKQHQGPFLETTEQEL